MNNKAFLYLAALATLFCACRRQAADHPAASPAEEQHGAEEIVIEEERQAVLGIETDTLSPAPFHEIIHTSGQLLSATGDEETVVAKSAGIVCLANLSEGSPIGRGDRIATLASKDLETGDRLLKARSEYETARREYERDKELLKDNIVSQSHYDRNKMLYEQAKSTYEAFLRNGASENGFVVASPLSGFVKSLNVSQGAYVEMGQPIATVSRNRRLRLRADVSEKYFDKLSQIRDAAFKTGYRDETFRLQELNGRLIGYGQASDGDFYIPVTFELDNRKNLIPGSYVEIFLKTTATADGLSVPLGAVVEDQGLHYVYVQHEPDAFLRKEVRIGASDGTRVQLLEGVHAGDAVVVKGAVQVKLASVSGIPEGHGHHHE